MGHRMIISNIRVTGYTEKVSVKCPDCEYENSYFVHPVAKAEVIRTCYRCGAVLEWGPSIQVLPGP